ncbi:PRMT5-domain-containing protein, partial [Metschnikowia bicuspidata var. bicuspidata NRRL YB-4993]
KLAPFSDMLIDPLQPLSVDMELDVYETFEKDRTKYRQYELAVEMAVSDLSHIHDRLNILVIGPGRGPLIEIVMKFARKADKVTAVEKNPKCFPTLIRLCGQWPTNVELVLGDVRYMGRPKLASFHLVVSELLGSFACNEAAPEILSVFRGLSPVMIPQEMRSFIQPVYADLGTNTWPRRPYVAKLNSCFPACEPAAIFEFVYPGENALQKTQNVTFHSKTAEVANALCGYFEACLYGPYRIGIVPGQSRLEYCDSWFPMLFPIPTTELPLSVRFLRQSLATVTYQWTVNGVS